MIDCTDVVIRFGSPLSRIQLQSSTGIEVAIHAPVFTSMVEVWKCSNVNLSIGVSLATMQLDGCQQVSAKYAKKEYFKTMVFAASDDLKLR